MAWTDTNTVAVGQATKKSDYDKIFDNADYLKDYIKGDNAEGSGATGHDHDGTDSLFVTATMPWMIDINVFMTPKSQIGSWTLGWEDTAVFNSYILSTAQNNERTWDVILGAGTWAVELMFCKTDACGIYSVQFDSAEKGTIDSYNGASSVNNLASVAGIVVATTAKVELKLKMATKNGSSSGYRAYLQNIRLLRTV